MSSRITRKLPGSACLTAVVLLWAGCYTQLAGQQNIWSTNGGFFNFKTERDTNATRTNTTTNHADTATRIVFFVDSLKPQQDSLAAIAAADTYATNVREIEHLQDSMEHDPEIYNHLGYRYAWDRDTLNAASNFTRSIELGWNPPSHSVFELIASNYYRNAINLFAAGDTISAYRTFDSARSSISHLDSNEASQIYIKFSDQRLSEGDFSGAVSDLRKALLVDSDGIESRLRLASALAAWGQAGGTPVVAANLAKLQESASILETLHASDDSRVVQLLETDYAAAGDEKKLNRLKAEVQSRIAASEMAQRKQSEERDRERRAAIREREARIKRNGATMFEIPQPIYGSDLWWFRSTLQFQGMINNSSYAIRDGDGSDFRIVTPDFVGDWMAVAIFAENNQSLIGVIEYAPFTNEYQRSNLFGFALTVGANCPPDQGYYRAIQDAAQRRSTTIKDEDGTPRSAVLYTWNSNDLTPLGKITPLNVAVIQPSAGRPGEVAFWRDDTRVER